MLLERLISSNIIAWSQCTSIPLHWFPSPPTFLSALTAIYTRHIRCRALLKRSFCRWKNSIPMRTTHELVFWSYSKTHWCTSQLLLKFRSPMLFLYNVTHINSVLWKIPVLGESKKSHTWTDPSSSVYLVLHSLPLWASVLPRATCSQSYPRHRPLFKQQPDKNIFRFNIVNIL